MQFYQTNDTNALRYLQLLQMDEKISFLHGSLTIVMWLSCQFFALCLLVIILFLQQFYTIFFCRGLSVELEFANILCGKFFQ